GGRAGGGVRQRLHEYLAERPAGASSEELLDLVFTSQGRDPEFGLRFLGALLGSDPRFRFDPDERRWRACVHDALARPLADTSFVVVDLETVGGAPAASGITEIGAVRVANGRRLDSLATPVHPGRPAPALVRPLPG